MTKEMSSAANMDRQTDAQHESAQYLYPNKGCFIAKSSLCRRGLLYFIAQAEKKGNGPGLFVSDQMN